MFLLSYFYFAKDYILNSLRIKKIEEKSIVWFQNSNQYLILEDITADIVHRVCSNEDIKEIAKILENDLAIPFEKAVDFINDIIQKIVKSNLILSTSKFQKNKDYIIPENFEFTKFYDINNKIFRVDFSNEFELSLIHPKFAHLEINSSQEVDFLFQTFNNEEDTYLTLESELIGSWNKKDIHYFQGKFSMKIIECIYDKLEDQWMGVFHASAIGKKENSILVLGDSGNGKSTSLSLLQAHSFNCIADDFVPVDDAEKVHSFPAGISIKKNSLPILTSYYPELESSAEFHYKRLNKVVRYLPPTTINYKKSFPCKALVFIKYDKTIDFEMKQISNLKAFENLIPDSWISPKSENVSIFLDWFSSLPCYQLTYSSNQKMIEAIHKVFDNEL